MEKNIKNQERVSESLFYFVAWLTKALVMRNEQRANKWVIWVSFYQYQPIVHTCFSLVRHRQHHREMIQG